MNSPYANWLSPGKTVLAGTAALGALALLASIAGAQPPFPVQPNEVLSYQFQPGVDNLGTEGGIIDYSGNNYNGTALSLGGPSMKIMPGNPAAPTPSYAIAMAGDDYFPGTGIYVPAETSTLGLVSGSFTLMAWVNRNNLKKNYTDQFIFADVGQETLTGASPVPSHGLQCGYRYNVNSDGTFDTYFGFWNDDSSAPNMPSIIGPASSPTSTPWHHMAWRYTMNGGLQDIFIDGVKVNSDPNHAPLAGSSNFLIGRSYLTFNGQQAAFAGLIEHPRVFNVALTDAQIAAAAKYQY